MKYSSIILIILTLLSSFAYSQKADIREGNNLYQDTNYLEAELSYRKALDQNPESVKANFNLGNTLYKQKRFDEASDVFFELTNNAKICKEQSSDAWYNLGNCALEFAEINKDTLEKQQKFLLNSIESYKNALRTNSANENARYNLTYAKKLLQKNRQQQQNQKNQDQKDQKNQDQKDQDKKDQQKKDQQNKDQKDKDQQKQEKQDQQNKDQQQKKDQSQQQQAQAVKLSKKDAERMLQAMKNKEEKTMEKLKKEKAVGVPLKIEKDW